MKLKTTVRLIPVKVQRDPENHELNQCERDYDVSPERQGNQAMKEIGHHWEMIFGAARNLCTEAHSGAFVRRPTDVAARVCARTSPSVVVMSDREQQWTLRPPRR